MTPAPDQIRAQLDRVVASAGFASSDRARRFLRYVVDRTLKGEGDQLKEYVIGREVFDRGDDYDPRIDSIVRVEAGRLRAKVEEYYAGPGRGDWLVIQLRRGGYAPTFEARTPEPPPAHPSSSSPAPSTFRWRLGAAVVAAFLVVVAVVAWRGGTAYVGGPSIAVLPFASYSTEESAQLLAARVTDGVTSELARLGTLSVVSHTSARQYAAGTRQPLREIAQALNAEIVLEGHVRLSTALEAGAGAGRIVINLRLVDAATDRKFWVKDFEGTAPEIPDVQRAIAKGVSAAALQRAR